MSADCVARRALWDLPTWLLVRDGYRLQRAEGRAGAALQEVGNATGPAYKRGVHCIIDPVARVG